MKFENIRVYNFENALRGMRNPKESWNKSDSYFGIIDVNDDEHDYEIARKWNQTILSSKTTEDWDAWLMENGILSLDVEHQHGEAAFIGPNDMNLATRLINAGSEHRKFLRQIFVTVDITAPLYFLKELDTYKIGTVANSTSTMHKITSKPITIDCFEIDDYTGDNEEITTPDLYINDFILEELIPFLEKLRQKYLETKDKRYWKELIRWLPESWLQTRTITMNYENLLTICHQRENHKLTEWSNSFINFAKKLPYAEQFIFMNNDWMIH